MKVEYNEMISLTVLNSMAKEFGEEQDYSGQPSVSPEKHSFF